MSPKFESAVIYITFCLFGRTLNNVNGFEITGFFQKLLRPSPAIYYAKVEEVTNIPIPDLFDETEEDLNLEDQRANTSLIFYVGDDINGTKLYVERSNGSLLHGDLSYVQNRSIDEGVLEANAQDMNVAGPQLRRSKRQFSSSVASPETGMFAKMTSMSYQVLQRCFEFWFENLFTSSNLTIDAPTHPFHARSARKIGYFTRKLVNATYRRLDQEE